MVMVSLFVMSCSKIPEEREVTVSNVEVSGFIKDYIEVVDGTYKFTNDGEEGRVTIKLKLKAQPMEAYHEKGYSKIRINAIGENGEIFDTGVYGFEAGNNEFDKVKDLLANGKVGDIKSVSFTWQYLGQDKDLAARIFSEAMTLEIIDDGFAAGEKLEETSSTREKTGEGESDTLDEESWLGESDETNLSKKSDIDYDKWIDEYEEYFKLVAKYYKKMQNGDQSAYADYIKSLDKFSELQSKLQGVEKEMTPAQMARISRILQQFTNEIQQ